MSLAGEFGYAGEREAFAAEGAGGARRPVVTMVAALLGEFEALTLGDELRRFPADIREEVQPR
jgi:hypothetical protein